MVSKKINKYAKRSTKRLESEGLRIKAILNRLTEEKHLIEQELASRVQGIKVGQTFRFEGRTYRVNTLDSLYIIVDWKLKNGKWSNSTKYVWSYRKWMDGKCESPFKVL